MKIQKITPNIYRIRESENTENLLERYQLISVPDSAQVLQPGCGYHMECDTLVLDMEDGFRFQMRIQGKTDTPLWNEYAEGFEQSFSKLQLNYKIKGRPDTIRDMKTEKTFSKSRNGHFGIMIPLQEEEDFYGLGEAARNTLNLRGGEYQNWAAYQFDEVPIPLVMSTAGWGMLVNASGRHYMDIGKRHQDRMVVMGDEDELDIFLFRGSSLQELLHCYTQVTGPMMLLPKWAYGLTYIPSIVANQHEVLSDARTFRQEHIPCDHISIEPQWMSRFYDYSLDRQWNLEKFHMPDFINAEGRPEFGSGGRDGKYSFIDALKRHGFHVSLWLCEQYDFTDEAERIAQGKEQGKLAPWYEHLKKFVGQGVDGFKLDPADTLDTNCPDMVCSNGYSEVEMHNLSQVLLPKQVWEGMAKQLNQRPMLHYCGGYTGIHRWTAANTGDNGGLKNTMIWLQSLGLSGHNNTTVDMDIHFKESMHFAMFAPWAHLNAWMGCGQPWWETPEMYECFKDYARLRYRLLPYIYSTAIEARETAMPILRAMPLAFPGDKRVKDVVEQYLFGPNLMIQSYSDKVVFPEGNWVDLWTGEGYSGGTVIDYTPPENRGGGLFVRKGAIIPMWEDRDYVSQKNDETIILEIWPDGFSTYTLREDDGESLDYLTQPSCKTQITCEEAENHVRIVIGQRAGNYMGKPDCRKWIVRVHTGKSVQAVCDGQDKVMIEVIP